MKLIAITIVLLGAADIACASAVPMPRPRPASMAERFHTPAQAVAPAGSVTSLAPAPELQGLPKEEPELSACQVRLFELARFTPLPTVTGPGECGIVDAVRLESVTMPDKSRVAVEPPAVLRCGMAEAVSHWVRTDVAPAAAELGAPLTAIANFDSYDCRGRNRVIGAKMSEHGRGNALDVRGIKLGNGKMFELTQLTVAKEFRERVRAATCGRFNTVLGPGADGYHENHVHMDLAERSRGYKLCQWDVREQGVVAGLPLPKPKPAALLAVEQ